MTFVYARVVLGPFSGTSLGLRAPLGLWKSSLGTPSFKGLTC